jgi:hypothetical protein
MGNIPLTAVYSMLIRHLTTQGWGAIILDGRLQLPQTGDPNVYSMDGILEVQNPLQQNVRGVEGDSLQADWTIDPDNEIISTGGVNYYRAIALKVTRGLRKFHMDLGDPQTLKRYELTLKSADAMVSIIDTIKKNFIDKGIPVRFIGPENYYSPNGILNMYCAANRAHGMEFIEINYAYEWYYRAGEFGTFQNFTAENLTRHLVHCVAETPLNRFEDWRSTVSNPQKLIEKSRSLLNQNRTGNQELPDLAKEALARINEHKARGGKVACLFGKLLFDVMVPKDDGPAHSTMVDWLIDTVETLADTNTLLLVKPHTAELKRPEHDLPEEMFCDLLPTPLPQNVIVCDHFWYNLSDLLPVIDLGIIWRGTVAIELAMAKIPTVVAGNFQIFDKVLDLPKPGDRDSYHQMLADSTTCQISDKQRERAALYLEFMRSSSNFLHFPFARFSPFKKLKPYPKWIKSELRKYEKDEQGSAPLLDTIFKEHIA